MNAIQTKILLCGDHDLALLLKHAVADSFDHTGWKSASMLLSLCCRSDVETAINMIIHDLSNAATEGPWIYSALSKLSEIHRKLSHVPYEPADSHQKRLQVCRKESYLFLKTLPLPKDQPWTAISSLARRSTVNGISLHAEKRAGWRWDARIWGIHLLSGTGTRRDVVLREATNAAKKVKI